MLVTTSRNASMETKKSALAYSVDKKAKYLNRGKKTIEEVISIARKNGNTRIAVVKSKDQIDFIQLHHGDNWEWV